MTLPVADAWGQPLLASLPVHEAGVGYSFETPVWPRANGMLPDVTPRQTVAVADDPDAQYAYVEWLDESVTPPRRRLQRLVRLSEGMFVHDGWVPPVQP